MRTQMIYKVVCFNSYFSFSTFSASFCTFHCSFAVWFLCWYALSLVDPCLQASEMHPVWEWHIVLALGMQNRLFWWYVQLLKITTHQVASFFFFQGLSLKHSNVIYWLPVKLRLFFFLEKREGRKYIKINIAVTSCQRVTLLFSFSLFPSRC